MQKYSLFLKWWLFFVLILVMGIFTHYLGMFSLIWEKDATYISYTTMVIFLVFSVICGHTTYRLCKTDVFSPATLASFARYEEVGWFVSELCLTLGMLGTIVGFVMMLSGFDTLDLANPQTVQHLLTELGRSMATALYTTLVGLVCGTMLKIQYFNLSLELQKINGSGNNDACKKAE